MERYLLIDVRVAACSRKHIISKRKQVHACQKSRFTSENYVNFNIYIKVFTVCVYGKQSSYAPCYYIM